MTITISDRGSRSDIGLRFTFGERIRCIGITTCCKSVKSAIYNHTSYGNWYHNSCLQLNCWINYYIFYVKSGTYSFGCSNPALAWALCWRTHALEGGRAGATGGCRRYVYTEIHRSVKLSVNHKGNCQSYMHKECATCLFFMHIRWIWYHQSEKLWCQIQKVAWRAWHNLV